LEEKLKEKVEIREILLTADAPVMEMSISEYQA
jgi:hypothetical protein